MFIVCYIMLYVINLYHIITYYIGLCCNILDYPRLYTFYFLSKQIKKLKGDILDIGCMKGGVGILLSFMNTNGRVMLFDTFEGFLDKETL